MTSNTRLKFIDISRGLAITFIVFGHTIVHSKNCYEIYKLLYSFHVALFFIISGYTFKMNKSFWTFFIKKVKRIIIPYLFWSILFIIPYLLFGSSISSQFKLNYIDNIWVIIKNIIYGVGYNKSLIQNTSLWFLPALFTMNFFYYFIIGFLEEKRAGYNIMLLILVLIGFLSRNMVKYVVLPFGINTFLNLGFFFYIGYYMKNKMILKKENKLLDIIIFLIGISCALYNSIVSAVDYKYGYFIFMVLSGLSISYIIMILSLKIENNRLLEYIGRNTMGILIFHKLFVVMFQTKISIFSKLLNNSNIIIELVLAMVITIIAILISLVINKIIKKHSPILLGEGKE